MSDKKQKIIGSTFSVKNSIGSKKVAVKSDNARRVALHRARLKNGSEIKMAEASEKKLKKILLEMKTLVRFNFDNVPESLIYNEAFNDLVTEENYKFLIGFYLGRIQGIKKQRKDAHRKPLLPHLTGS